jgi:hypothetical protein
MSKSLKRHQTTVPPEQYPLPLGYAFLWQVRQPDGSIKSRRLNKTQVRELAKLSERWLRIRERWGITGRPGETLSMAAGRELDKLEVDLRDWGSRHGFIGEGPEYVIPEFVEPLKKLREARDATTPQGKRRSRKREVVFVPLANQKQVLEALDGKAFRRDALARELGCEPSQLTRYINELREEGLVDHHRRIGYYRPDALPPKYADWLKTQHPK